MLVSVEGNSGREGGTPDGEGNGNEIQREEKEAGVKIGGKRDWAFPECFPFFPVFSRTFPVFPSLPVGGVPFFNPGKNN